MTNSEIVHCELKDKKKWCVFNAAFNNISFVSSDSWVRYQFWRSFYPDTSKSVVMLTPQPWTPRRAAITTIFKVFDMTRQWIKPQPPAPEADALPLHHREGMEYLTIIFTL